MFKLNNQKLFEKLRSVHPSIFTESYNDCREKKITSSFCGLVASMRILFFLFLYWLFTFGLLTCHEGSVLFLIIYSYILQGLKITFALFTAMTV